jgi:ArsR family transcriptional regulator
MTPFDDLLTALRAAAEPTRLRMLSILSRGEFAVTELTEILGQSQPRVSRHLKLLGEAGLLEKFREQHWIYYRVPAAGEGAELVRTLLERIEPADPQLGADLERVEAILEQRRRSAAMTQSPAGAGDGAGGASEIEEVTRAVAAELGDRGRSALFYFGAAPTEVLGAVAARARRVVGMHSSRREVQRARAALHSRGLSHCLLQQGELRSLPQPGASFDTAVLDRSLAAQSQPVEALREVARLLKSGGELLLVEDYDALAQRAPAANPLSALRHWLADAGLVCARLRPLDAGGRHLLLALAHADTSATADAAA